MYCLSNRYLSRLVSCLVAVDLSLKVGHILEMCRNEHFGLCLKLRQCQRRMLFEFNFFFKSTPVYCLSNECL